MLKAASAAARKGQDIDMEIERIVSGDLNKNIEQCVSILMDVERRVSALKTELTQTIQALPANRSLVTGPTVGSLPTQVTGFPNQAPLFVATPWGLVGAPQGILGIYPTPQANAPIVPLQQPTAYALPHVQQSGVQGTYPTPVTPYAVPYASFHGVPVQAFAPGLGPVQNFGYIW